MSSNNNNLGRGLIVTIIIACMCIVTALSVYVFQGFSIRLDESQSVWQSSHSPLTILNLIGQDVHVPLYPMILHGWIVAFGNDVGTIRILSLIFFLLSIPIFYVLGRRIYPAGIVLFATVLFSISPFMNWYANEARMYSLLVLVSLINMYFFIGITKNNSTSSWLGFTVSALFGIYTHYFFWLLLLSSLIFYVFNRHLFAPKAFRNILFTTIILVVAFAPWVTFVVLLGKVSNSTPNLLPPTSVDLFNTFSAFFIGFQNDYINTIFLSLWPILTLFGFMSLRRGIKVDSKTIYMLLVFVIPIAIAFFVSAYFRPIFLSRYVIFALPAMYLLACWFLYRFPRGLVYFFSVIIAIMCVGGLVLEVVSASTPVKEDYRGVSQYLESNAGAGDVIVVSAPFTIYPIMYYYHGADTITTLPIWDQNKIGPIPPFSEERLPQEIDTIRDSHSNVWVVLSYDQGYSEKIRIYFDTHFERLLTKTFSPGLILYEYKLRYI